MPSPGFEAVSRSQDKDSTVYANLETKEAKIQSHYKEHQKFNTQRWLEMRQQYKADA